MEGNPQVCPLPHANRAPLIFLDLNDPPQEPRRRPDVELYRRFPWLEFKNSLHKKTYAYLGRDTEQTRPFLLRFSLSEEEVARSELDSGVGGMLRRVAKGVMSPERLQEGKLAESVREMHNRAIDQTLFTSSSFCVHYGYLLTGIARPSTTANDAFDALFPLLALPLPPLPDHPSLRAAYNQLQLQWEFKYHSYEYFRFMSRACQELSRQLGARLQPEEVGEAVSRELFNFGRAEEVRGLDARGQEQVTREADYFSFFGGLLWRNHEAILRVMAQKPKERTLTVEVDGQKHELRGLNFQEQLRRELGGQVGQEALRRMVEHNLRRQEEILTGYTFMSRKKRADRLRQLGNNRRDLFNRIQLLPLLNLQEHSLPGEDDRHFLLLLQREGLNASAPCSLRDVLDHRLASVEGEADVRIRKERLFRELHRQTTKAKEYPLLNCFTCDPAALALEQGELVPDFEAALAKFLGMDRLPLTPEQELLACTPREDINHYQKLEELVEEYSLCCREKTVNQLCEVLNGEGLMTEPCDLETEVTMVEKEEPLDLRLATKLLQLSMVEYELTAKQHCFNLHSEDNETPTAFSALVPQHHKLLRQHLAYLLVQTHIAPAIQIASSSFHPAALTAIANIKDLYEKNRKLYRELEECSSSKSLSQADQTAFLISIRGLFQELEDPTANLTHRLIREALRAAHKTHIILEFMQARLLLVTGQGSREVEEKALQGVEALRGCVEGMAREERQEGRSETQERCKAYQRFSRELKEGQACIQREFGQCRELLQRSSLLQRREQALRAMRAQSAEVLEERMSAVRGASLLWFCSVHEQVLQVEEEGRLAVLYKVLLCFCCQLPQFHCSQALHHLVWGAALAHDRLELKIHEFKNILLTELIAYLVKNWGKYQ